MCWLTLNHCWYCSVMRPRYFKCSPLWTRARRHSTHTHTQAALATPPLHGWCRRTLYQVQSPRLTCATAHHHISHPLPCLCCGTLTLGIFWAPAHMRVCMTRCAQYRQVYWCHHSSSRVTARCVSRSSTSRSLHWSLFSASWLHEMPPIGWLLCMLRRLQARRVRIGPRWCGVLLMCPGWTSLLKLSRT